MAEYSFARRIALCAIGGEYLIRLSYFLLLISYFLFLLAGNPQIRGFNSRDLGIEK